jgi:membrane-bound lytic murein transglycosylase D
MIKGILRDEGVPEDLAYLVLIESGFNPRARSPRGATGLWQFMRGTGRRYGLRIDRWVDERRDPEKSTHAAARYLRDLHTIFNSWELAIAAYNAGDARISKGLRRRKVESFWELCRYPDLKRENKDFLPKFAAALKIAKDPEGHGYSNIPYEKPWRFSHITISESLDLQTIARLADTTPEEIRELNPQLRRRCTPPGPLEVKLRVPEGAGEGFSRRLAKLPSQQRPNVRVHRVKSGETLGNIAGQYGSQTALIKKTNGLSSVHRIREGSELLIPVLGCSVEKGRDLASREGNHGKEGQSQDPANGGGADGAIVHRVKPGDSLWAISRRYGVKISEIRRWNKLNGNHIRPGDALILRKEEI